ncbi:hypothetical protein [Kitasatospora sp. NPDC088346]|uniref:hypothetical protein n=1 Tax=Kitasatospora sp. NPDC088346 TaxID=3364073 RepID=UPI00381AF53A
MPSSISGSPTSPPWFDATSGTWESRPIDRTRYRIANAFDRSLVTGILTATVAANGYADADAVPVYSLRRYRPRPGRATTGTRPAELRMLDRVARIGMGVVGDSSTPHLAATVMPNSRLGIAGNTGNRMVTSADQARVDREFTDFANPSVRPYGEPRSDKDLRKFRALLSGDYADAHGNSTEMATIASAIRGGADWTRSLVGAAGPGSQHGEMTMLAEHVQHWRANPVPTGQPVRIVNMGGFKLACAGCQWAFDVTNDTVGRQYGYRVVASGTHGQLYPGWLMPDWLANDTTARNAVMAKAAAAGASFRRNAQGRYQLQGQVSAASSSHNPADSESDWEQM